MAHTPFPVEVLTPEGEVFNGEAEQVSTTTTVGSLSIFAHHEPLLATIEASELRVYTSETEILRFETGDGYLQVGDNHVLILVKDAKPATEAA
jgi:F-type H+-transporting ATPase subunit epsilon